jgi:hypothetical protein
MACQASVCLDAPECIDAAACPAAAICHAVDCVDFACQDTPQDGVVCDDGRICTNDDHCMTGTCVASTPKPISLTDVGLNDALGLHFEGVGDALRAGSQVGYAGDVNGDGIHDLFVSTDKPMTGFPKVYVIFGGPTLETATLAGVAGGVGGFVIEVDSFNSAISVAAAGDMNGDKRSDIAIGMPSFLNANGSGAVYLIRGKAADTDPIKLSALGNSGVVVWGPKATNTYLGTSVIGLGDVNGDMRNDIAVGAPGYKNGNNVTIGAVYVIYGQPNPADTGVETLIGNGGALRIEGPTVTTDFGRVVGSVGDFNKDGRFDVAVGQPNYNNSAGRATVVYLPTGPLPSVITVPDVMMPSQGLVVTNGMLSGKFGVALGPAGDFNGDGAPDLVIGSGSVLNKAVVVLGGLIGGTIDAGTLVNTNKGFILTGAGNDAFGAAVWGGLDVNGDTTPDILVGAPSANTGGGRVYVAFGRDTPANIAATDLAQGKGGFALEGQGDQAAGGSVGLVPDLDADGRNELFIGARQYDVIPGDNVGRAYLVYGGDCKP